MRGTFDANEATKMRPLACEKIDVNASPTARSSACARALGVGGIGEHAEHALVADRGDSRKIGRLAVDRRLIELEVAGMEDRSNRRAQRERASPGDRVVHVDELGFDRAIAHAAARLDLGEVDLTELLLARFRFDQGDRKRRRGDRGLRKLTHEVRNAADVVFVPMGHEQAAQLVCRSRT